MKQRDDGAERGGDLRFGRGRRLEAPAHHDPPSGCDDLPPTRLRAIVRQQLRTIAVSPAVAPPGPTAPVAAPAAPPGDKGELYRNFGDGFTRAFELAVTPVVFGAMGYGLDRWLGIVPIFTTLLVLAAVIGLLLRTWYGYVNRMEALEQAGPWAQQTRQALP